MVQPVTLLTHLFGYLSLEVVLLPTITYKGRRRTGANLGRLGWWIWGKPREVSAEWLDAHRSAVDGSDFVIEGHTFEKVVASVDEGNDGIPDMGWTKGDILAWMEEKDIASSSLSTKKKLLAAIDEHLNPTEDTKNEAEEAQTTGDE